MTNITTIITTLIMPIGAFFCFSAALGLLRLPDIYSRMHAASKAATLGIGILLLAVSISAPAFQTQARAIAGILFFIITAPVASHLLARAAYAAGTKPAQNTQINQINHNNHNQQKNITGKTGNLNHNKNTPITKI